MTTLLSYHSDKKLKTEMVEEMLKHQRQDQLIKGTYGIENGLFKGCAVGCGVHSYNIRKETKLDYQDHAGLAQAIGIPEWLFRLQDALFEGLVKEEALKFPVQFYKASPIGVDLEPIKWKFCAFLLKENLDRVMALTLDNKIKQQVVEAIQGCLKLHENATRTERWDESAARSAWSAAWSAARSAAAATSCARKTTRTPARTFTDSLCRNRMVS